MKVKHQTLDPCRSNNRTLHFSRPFMQTNMPTFEFRVIYIRIITSLRMRTPTTISFPPKDLDTYFRVNGVKTNAIMSNTRCLNKFKEDKFLSEFVYVNTDGIQFRDKYLGFELNIIGCPIVRGLVRRKEEELGGNWVLECTEGASVAEFMAGGSMEVYCAGMSSGKAVLLNEVVKLKGLNENDFFHTKGTSLKDLYAKLTGELEHKNHDHSPNKEGEEEENDDTLQEENELAWFNQGLKVGIGLGMGMTAGLALGLGLAMKTYKTTSGSLKKLGL